MHKKPVSISPLVINTGFIRNFHVAGSLPTDNIEHICSTEICRKDGELLDVTDH